MKQATGLNREILASLILLMGAAFLFISFLLLTFTERQRIDQRLLAARGAMETTARVFSASGPANSGFSEEDHLLFGRMMKGFVVPFSLTGGAVADQTLTPHRVASSDIPFFFARADLLQARNLSETVVRLTFPSPLLPFIKKIDGDAAVTVPVFRGGVFAGALQGRFSFADIRSQVAGEMRVVFLYAVLYGTVLVFFGMFLLRRSVIQPVRHLREKFWRVGAGELECQSPVFGPREIQELDEAFADMTEALKISRRQTQETIQSLQRSNQELTAARDELVRSEKMASVGQLAAGMAHEIGNPLGAVLGYLGILEKELSQPAYLELVKRGTEELGRIDLLVKELLDFAAPMPTTAEPADPLRALCEARELMEHQGLFSYIELRSVLPEKLPVVPAVHHRLVQVFVNLLLNAKDAVDEGGLIQLSAGEEEDSIWLTITDNGAGIGKQELQRIFDPFYTTKAPGKGRGLGLAISQRIISEAGGRLSARSVAGEGSTFEVCFPKVEPQHESKP